MAAVTDRFDRPVRDLRISVTDRCNFRCTYCMPEEGMVWLPRSEVLTFEEIVRLARIFVERFEVDGLRLTGGEPTVHPGLLGIIRGVAQTGVADVAMTTNGSLVSEERCREWRGAGLTRSGAESGCRRGHRGARCYGVP